MIGFLKRVIRKWLLSDDSEMIRINKQIFRLTKGTFKEDYDDAWLYGLAKKSNSFLDIGANLGFHTILGFAGGSLRHSVLVDANSDALSIAGSNVLHNGFGHQVNFYKGFVSDKDNDEITFWTSGAGAAGSIYSSHAKTAKKDGSSTQVSTITVDSIVSLFNMQPDLIKVDVEGAESKVLQGAIETTRKYKPHFLVEMHSMAELSMEQNTTLVLNWCKENNYNAFYLKEHTLITDPSLIKHRGRCHVLLIAMGKAYPDELKLIRQSDKIKEIEKVRE